MTFVIIENVRGYFGSRPPLVAFMIFLASMALGLITFAYFVSDMPKAVVDQEFNKFMERLSVVNLCLGGEREGSGANSTIMQSPASGAGRMSYVERMKRADSPMVRDLDREMWASTSTGSSVSSPAWNSVVNVSVTMIVEIAATASVQSLTAHHNTTTITASLWASQLGRAGQGQDMEAIVTVVLPSLGNRSHSCQRTWHGQCYRVRACVTMTAPRHFFPHMQRQDRQEICHREPEQGGVNHLHGEVVQGFERCANASLVHLQHIYDSSNHGVIFMRQDRSAINLHLMHSSYFLFVMVISLFCYAIIRGRPAKVKVVHSQCSTDKVNGKMTKSMGDADFEREGERV